MVSEPAPDRKPAEAASRCADHPTDGRAAVPTTSLLDGARVLGTVVAPVVTGGAIARRPRAMLATERAGLDKHAVATMQHLRDRYGPGPVQVRLPGRRFTFPTRCTGC